MLRETNMRSLLERYLYNKIRNSNTGQKFNSVNTKNFSLLKLDTKEFEEKGLTTPLKIAEQNFLFKLQKDFYLRDCKLKN